MPEPIPRMIENDEVLVRCMMHPLHYRMSKEKLDRLCFMPVEGQNDVSVLRRSYARDDSFCKSHCRSLHYKNQSYLGMVIILASHIREVKIPQDQSILIDVKATPMDSDMKVIPPHIEVDTDTPGLPMHADIVYDKPLIRGETKSAYRAIAYELCQVAKAFVDQSADEIGWNGPELKWNYDSE